MGVNLQGSRFLGQLPASWEEEAASWRVMGPVGCTAESADAPK